MIMKSGTGLAGFHYTCTLMSHPVIPYICIVSSFQ